MPYGNKYVGSFNPINNTGNDWYSIIIREKDYTGDPIEVLLAGTPIIHEWQEDDPLKPIKGSTLKISIINNGVVSLDDFYSEDDSKYYVELYENNSMTYHFRGFLVQDDCSEIQVDFAHEINLTATDNLGLLKEVSLGQAARNTGTPSAIISGYCTSPGGHTLYVAYINNLPFVSGDKIYLYNGTTLVHTYTVLKNNGYVPFSGWDLDIVELLPVISYGSITGFQYIIPTPLNTYLSLAELLYLCLSSTNVITYTNVYSQLIPVGGSTGRWIEDTYLDGRTFLDGNQWDSCYEVLEKIMTRFHATLFQAKGEWQIVRWGELPLVDTMAGATLVGYQYLSNMQYINDVTLSDNFVYGDGTDIETGLIKSIIRPYQYTKETFRFRQMSNLLCNSDLQDLGEFRTTYVVGNERYDEYEWNCWTDDTWWPADTQSTDDRYIRVVTDLTKNKEVDRYAVLVRNYPTGGTHSAQSAPIQVTKGDVITLSFSFRSENSYTGYTETNFKMNLHTASQFLSFGDNQSAFSGGSSNLWTWQPVVNTVPYLEDWYFGVFDGYNGDSTNWMDVTVTTLPAPDDGILYVYLSDFPRNVGNTYFKNFTFNITNAQNNLQNVTGQTHTDTQVIGTKNNSDISIYMDDSLSSTVSGILYLESYIGTLRDKTTVWNYSGLGPTYEKILGNLTTVELMFLRYLARIKYEGGLLGINKGGKRLTLLSVLTLNITNGNFRFIFGSLSLDYKNNIANATMWQMTDFEDLPVNNTNYYEFNYLYQNN